jgi:hypothetical protein
MSRLAAAGRLSAGLRLVVFAGVLLAAGCAGGSRSDAEAAAASLPPLSLEETPPQGFRAGACHLVLWTRSEPSRRILVAWSQPGEAIVQVRGQALSLPLSEVSGAARQGHYERQVWKSPAGVVLADVRFEPLPGAEEVAAIRSAAVSFTDPRGETVVTPAVGMVSCGAPPATPPPS